MTKFALFVRLEAKPGQEAAVAEFLAGALPLANAESGTTAWFALTFGPSTFGVFDAFADEAGREAIDDRGVVVGQAERGELRRQLGHEIGLHVGRHPSTIGNGLPTGRRKSMVDRRRPRRAGDRGGPQGHAPRAGGHAVPSPAGGV